MIYNVPGEGSIELKTIILDLNGTLSVKGKIPEGVKERLQKLTELGFEVVLFTGDQRGTADELTKDLGISFLKTKDTQEKENAAKEFDASKTVAIGNARIDIGTFRNARLKIATLQAEGIHTGILSEVDVVVPSINDAFDFLIDPDIFSATMRF